MSHYILFNDEFFAADHAILKSSNRGFKFGDGLFESMRMCNGKLQFAEQHADRLRAGMKALKMEGYALLDEYFLRQKTAELLKKNKFKINAGKAPITAIQGFPFPARSIFSTLKIVISNIPGNNIF